jgi:RHS repeat-associated protein
MGIGSTSELVGLSNGSLEALESYAYDAYGNLRITPTGPLLTSFLYSGEMTDAATGQQYLRARYYDPVIGRFNRLDPFAGNTSDPQSLHKYLYAHADPISNADPTGEWASAVGTIAGAGIRSAMISGAISVPFRGLEAAADLAAGASLRDVALGFAQGVLFDSALGAVLGGGGAAFARSLGSNGFKIRALGQSIAGFRFARLPGSAWRLAPRLRGLAIEKVILNRAASFGGRVIKNFPVIDDFILRGTRGIATSVKSLDLTAQTYQNTSQLLSRLNSFAHTLQRFSGAARQGFRVGPGGHAITDKILVVAFEQGAATSSQAQVIARFVREASTSFPGVKVVVQFVL